MSEQQDVERFNIEALKAFAERAGEGPVAMLNLLAFRPDGGQERYAEYAQAVAPLLAGVGGRIVGAYRPSPTLIGDLDWDLVAVVEYPTRQALLDMVSTPEYQAIMHLRTDALSRAALVPMEAADDLPAA